MHKHSCIQFIALVPSVCTCAWAEPFSKIVPMAKLDIHWSSKVPVFLLQCQLIAVQEPLQGKKAKSNKSVDLWKRFSFRGLLYNFEFRSSLSESDEKFRDQISKYNLEPPWKATVKITKKIMVQSFHPVDLHLIFEISSSQRCSTCGLVFGCWELSHGIFLKLRNRELLA